MLKQIFDGGWGKGAVLPPAVCPNKAVSVSYAQLVVLL